MGIKLFSVDSAVEKVYPPGTPNPRNFDIVDWYEEGDYVLAKIVYRDCRNYGGKKLLLFKGINYSQLRSLKEIDPHFIENSLYAPIARFEPTFFGSQMGKLLIKNLRRNRLDE